MFDDRMGYCTEALESLPLVEIDNLLFKISPKAKLIACILKVGCGFMSGGAREIQTHYGDP